MKNKNNTGHIAALITILIWGTTFISTKILLAEFEPVEILFFRFLIGFLALSAAHPHRLRKTNTVQALSENDFAGRHQELTFALAGLCGVCLYYLLENIALTFTMASNVGVIISAAPFFTAFLTHLFFKGEEPLRPGFFLGFGIAIAGICLISFNGSIMELNPAGDLLAIIAAFTWACYSVLTRKISRFGYPVIQTTRRIFFWGILFMIPTLFFFPFHFGPERFSNPVYLLNILFLGLCASALCFVTWNFAVSTLGAVKTSIYIYMVPVITVITSLIVLQEKITGLSALGVLLTLAGLIISEGKLTYKKRGHFHEFTK